MSPSHGYCGNTTSTFLHDGQVSDCYRGLTFLCLPAVVMLTFGVVRWLSVRSRNQLDVYMFDIHNYGWLDVARVFCLSYLGVSQLLVVWYQSSESQTTLSPFMIVDAFVFTLFPFLISLLVIGEEVRHGIPESPVVKIFLVLQLIGMSLLLHSVVMDDASPDWLELFQTINVAVTVLVSLLYVCFARDWHRIRRYARDIGISIQPLAGDDPNESLLRNRVNAWSMDFDEIEADLSKRSKEEDAGLFSVLTFSWLNSVMRTGYSRTLEEADLCNVRTEDQCSALGDRFYAEWEARQNRRELDPAVVKDENYKGDLKGIIVSLHKARIFNPFYQAFFFKIVYDCCLFVGPQISKRIISYIKSDNPDPNTGYLYAILMLATASLQTFVLHQYFHRCFRTGMRVRASLSTSVYKKSLTLTPAARNQLTTGEIVNLMSTDCQRMEILFPYLHIIWSAPFQLALCIYFLWAELQYAVLVSVCVISFVMTPLATWVGKRIKNVQKKVMKAKDERIKLTSEVISSMKSIKMYGWEESFCQQVCDARDNELRVLRRYMMLQTISRSLWTASPVIVTLSTFATFVAMNGNLDAETAFTSLLLLKLLQFPLAMLPNIFNGAIEASVSLRRLAKFFEAAELDPSSYMIVNEGHTTGDGGYVAPNTTEASLGDDKDAKDHQLRETYAAQVSSGTFYWDDDRKARALTNINWNVRDGELCVVTGEVGSGKTALLKMLVGDLIPENVTNPTVVLNGSVAYASQSPWILNSTLQENITFGSGFDRKWYDKVVFACCLTSDFDQLPNGDQTEIGERGINLSGGQKARVAMARAVYSKANLIMLESCFEAVDEHVRAHLWKHCIVGLLSEPLKSGMQSKPAIVLVTHALKFMPEADSIVVMKNGEFAQHGSYEALMSDTESEFARLVTKLQESQDSMKSVTNEKTGTNGEGDGEVTSDTEEDTDAAAPTSPKPANAAAANKNSGDKKDLTGEEARSEGNVSKEVYYQYIKASGGYLAWGSILFALCCRTLFQVGTDRWLAIWAKENGASHDHHDDPHNTTTATAPMEFLTSMASRALIDVMDTAGQGLGLGGMTHSDATQFPYHEVANGGSMDGSLWVGNASFQETDQGEMLQHAAKHGSGFYLGIYAVLSFASIAGMVSAVLVIAFSSLIASRKMHHSLITAITRAPMSFFDTTPLGRILNRFGKDMYSIDELLPGSVFSFLGTSFTVIGTVGVIAGVRPLFVVVLPFLFLGYFFVQRYYIASSREIKRLDSVLRSPIYSHFSESLEGASVIRAYRVGTRFHQKNMEQIQKSLRAYYTSIASNRWLAVRLEFIGTTLLVSSTFLIAVSHGAIDGALAGMALTYALQITQTLNWTVRMVSELETNIVSVERLNEYIETPPEAALAPKNEQSRPPAQWPHKGEIVFKNVCARYRPGLDNVVKGISFEIRAGEKVGIVGRTGAGKSSMMLILLRIIEPSAGTIEIDGFNTQDVGLSILRKQIAIIPQDAVMFSGSLRHNLDPLGNYSDEQIWRALECAKLAAHMKSLTSEECPDPLDFVISEGGGNFSFGQRQLISISRAVLRECKILLMDEATSGVDAATDHAIQETVKTEFADRTVLTIAHRIETIIESDRVMVMEKGLIAEFDEPNKLLRQQSLFKSLVTELNSK